MNRKVIEAAERSVNVNPVDQSLQPKIQSAIDRLNSVRVAPYPTYRDDVDFLASLTAFGGPLNAEQWTLDELLADLEKWRFVVNEQMCVLFEKLCYGASSLWHQMHSENFRAVDRKPDELSRWILEYAGSLHEDFPAQVLEILKQLHAKPAQLIVESMPVPFVSPHPVPLSDQCYQWIGVNGGHRVGRKVDLPVSAIEDRVLMRSHHTGQLELVDESAIKPYPSEPIPEP